VSHNIPELDVKAKNQTKQGAREMRSESCGAAPEVGLQR